MSQGNKQAEHPIVTLFGLWVNDGITDREFVLYSRMLKTIECGDDGLFTIPESLQPVAIKLYLMGVSAESVH